MLYCIISYIYIYIHYHAISYHAVGPGGLELASLPAEGGRGAGRLRSITVTITIIATIISIVIIIIVYTYVYIYIYIERERDIGTTPNLPHKVIPTKICRLRFSRKIPKYMRIPPLNVKIMIESSPLKSRILIRRLAVMWPRSPYARCSNEEPAKSGLESKRILKVEVLVS